MELDKHDVENGLTEQHALKWWAKDVLNKKDHNEDKVKSEYLWMSHRFSMKPPRVYRRHIEFIRRHRHLTVGMIQENK